MHPPAYLLEKVIHLYGNKKVLDIEHLEIPKRSITGLIGPNGSGKSTLLKLLAFAMRPTGGRILFNGRVEYPFSPVVRSRVTLVTQTPYLLKRSVFDNIAYGLKIRQDTGNLAQRIRRAKDSVGLAFDRFAHRRWHELSGGEAQRVALAARLVLKPEVLLLDEPVANVDTQSAALIRTAALAARENWGTTLVIASHDLAWLFDCTDTQISISSGTLFSTGVEVVIPGPYRQVQAPEQAWFKPLDDGQAITLPAMTGKEKTAVIQRQKIRLAAAPVPFDPADTPDNRITGQIQSMYMAGQGRQILTTVTMGGMSVMLCIDAAQAASLSLCPSTQVTLLFNSTDIHWH